MPRPSEIAADARALYGPVATRPTAADMGDGALWVDPGAGHALYQVQSGNWVTISPGESGGTVTSVGLSTSGVLHSVSGSPVTGSGTLALDLKTQVRNSVLAGPASGADAAPAMRALVAADIPSLDAGALGSGTVALARLGGLTTSQLSASAGIQGTQLDAAAAIASAQITALAAGKLTGAGTLPDAVLSTNVALLAAGNTFSAAQTVSASVAGVLAQITNSSTTGAGLVIGSTAVASAGAGKIAPALACTQAPAASANYGLLCLGSGPWDGSTSGKYVGSSSGTLLAGNAASGYGGTLLDLQVAGSSKIKGDSSGNLTLAGTLTALGEAHLSQGSFSDPAAGKSSALKISSTGNTGYALAVSNGIATDTLSVSGTFTPTGGVNASFGTFSDPAAGTGYGLKWSQGAIGTTTAARICLTAVGAASQTADLVQCQDSANHAQFGVMNGGTGVNPVWALRVRATANAESMAVSHAPGAATGKCLQVFDDAGSSLGYLALYA